jgi:exosortase
VAPCWWGVGLIILGQAARAFGLMFFYESAERYSLVLTVAGIVLLVVGRQLFWQLRWILLFLFLMVPLPGRIHNLISGPLQNLATAGAVCTLELFGVTVVREGNVMVLNDNVPVAVAEACSGLRMLTAFVVVAATLAYVVNRPRWQKATLVLSSVPIAILCNLARLVATAVLYMVASSEIAESFFHDFAGLTMMPLAVLVLVGELWIMARLVLDEPSAGPS